MAKKLNISAALKNAALVGAGAVGAQALENVAKKTVLKSANVKPAVMGGGKMVLGAFLPELLGRKNKGLAEGLGNGMIAAGALQIARQMAPNLVATIGSVDDVLAGIEGDESYNMDGGYQDEVSGVDDDTLAGLDDDL